MQWVKEYVAGWANTRLFLRSHHQQTSAGSASSSLPIILDHDGKIDPSFIEVSDYTEDIQDLVIAPMLTGNTETDIAVTYQDSDGTIDFVVSSTLVADRIHAATSKATPVDADELGLADSAASFVLKKLTWANLKATLKTYFDGFYGLLASTNLWTGTNTFKRAGALFVEVTGAATNALTQVLNLKGTSSGAVTDGGPSIAFELNDSSTSGTNVIAEIGVRRDGADNTGSFDFRVAVAGVMTRVLQITSSGLITPTIITPSIITPIIVTPTITSFANSTHTHADAAGGGTLKATAIVPTSDSEAAFGGSGVTYGFPAGTTAAGTVISTGTTTAGFRADNNGSGGKDWTVATAATGSAPSGASAGDLYLTEAAAGTVAVLTTGGTLTLSGINVGESTLSFYETSTWSPTITGSSSNPTVTYTTRVGTYTKIGTIVICRAHIVINTISGGGGDARFSLPFTSDANRSILSAATQNVDLAGTPVSLVGLVEASTAYVSLCSVQDNAALSLAQVSGLAAGDTIIFTGIYIASS